MEKEETPERVMANGPAVPACFAEQRNGVMRSTRSLRPEACGPQYSWASSLYNFAYLIYFVPLRNRMLMRQETDQ